jgi:eukaryotic-like serine/threonine-protein kinase
MNDFFARLWQRTKTYAIETYYFLTSKIFLINFGKILVLVLGFLALTFWWLTCYTKHGLSTTVPNLVGLRTEEAKRKAESMGFDVSVSDSIPVMDGKRPDVVDKQNPSPNYRVKEGRTIYLTVTRSTADMVVLPDMFKPGYDYYDYYIKHLAVIGVSPRIIDKRADARLTENTILDILVDNVSVRDRISQGVKVPRGCTVDFIVSTTETDETDMPNLVGLPFEGIETVLQGSSLVLGDVQRDASVTDDANAIVASQSPEVGTKIAKNTAVKILIKRK